MKIENTKVGKKFRIKFKDDDKSLTLNAIVTKNDVKKKLLKFENATDIYECQYKAIIKIQSFLKFKLKLIFGILTLIFLIILLGYYYGYYTNPKYHLCSGSKIEDGEGWSFYGTSCSWTCESFKCKCKCEAIGAYKPIIYLYPPKTTQVTVQLGYPENTTHTYPKYNQPWQVQAEPNGDLTDLKTGRHYYALYWEGKNTVSKHNPSNGFVVAGKDTIPFLEEKLDQLGLTEREAEEFIVYWLPKLESAKYNLIRFQTPDEQNKNMPLNITPAPQTLIRVMMEYKNLDKSIPIKKQILPPKPQRHGFTVVEWGGTNI